MWRICINTQMQRLLGSRGHRCCPCPIPVQYKSRCACPDLKNTPRIFDAQRRRMVHCKEQLAECEPPMACDILNSELNKQQKLSPSTHSRAEFSKRGLVRVARQEPISETVINRISWHRNPNSRNQFRHISVVSRRSKKYRDEKFKNQRTSLPDTLNDFQCRKCMPRIRRGRQRKTTLFDRVLDLLRDKNAQKRVRDLDDAVKQKAKLGMMPSRKESVEYFDCEEPHSGLTDFVENVKAKSKEIKDQLLQGEYADDLAISEDVPYPNKVQKISKEKKLPFEVGLPEEKPSESIEEDYMTLTEYEAEKGMRHESKLSRQSKPKTMNQRRGQCTSSWLTPRKQRELENLTRYAREMQSKNNLRNEMRDVEPSRKGDLPREKRERFSSKPKRMTGDEGLESNPMTYSDILNAPISSVMKQRQHKAKTIGRLKSQWKSCLDSERLLAVRMNHPFPKLMTVEEREKMERHHKDLESAIREKCKDRLYQNLCEEAGRQFRLGSAQSEQERRENEILRKCQTMFNSETLQPLEKHQEDLDEDVELHETAKSINLLELKRLQDMQQGRREFLNDEDYLSHVLMSQDGDVKSSGGNQCGKDGHGDKEQECEEEPEPCDKSKKDDGEQHEEVTKIVEDLWKKFQKEQQAAQCKEIVEAEEAKKKGESEMLKKCKTVKDKCKDLEMESECAKLKEDKGKKEGKEKSQKEGKKKSKKEGKEKSKKDGNEGKKESKGKGKKENDGQEADKELTKKCEEAKSKGPAKKEKGGKSGKSGGEKTKSTKGEGKADKEAQTVVEQIDNIIKQCETIKQNYQQTLSKKKNGDSKKKSAKADKKEEEKKNEEEMLNKCAEADKKKKEQEMKKKCAEAEKKKKEEEKKKNEGEMLKKCAEADKKKKEQEMKKKCAEAEKKKKEEEKKKNEGEMLKKCAEAEKKKKEQEMKKKCAEAEKKKEEELKKKCAEAEKKKKEEEMKKKCAEASKKAEEAKKKEAEMMKKCAEAKKKKQEEELKKKKAEADKKKKEEEMKKKCAEAKKLAEAQKKEEELKKKCAEAEKKKQEEELKKKCAEAEKKKKEEELKKKCAEASKKAEEAKKKEAEMLKKCAEAEKKKKEAELQKKCAEAEKKKHAEEAEAKAKAQEDELKKKCAELDKKKKENEQKKKCRVAELKKQCEAITKRQKEAKLAKKNKIKEDQRKLKEAAEQQKRCREMSAKKKKQSEEEECDGDDKSNFTSISGNNDIHGGLFLTPSISNMGGMLNAPHYLDDDFDVPQSSICKPGLFVDDVNNNSTGSMVVRRHGVVHPSRILPFLVNPFRMLPPSICCNTLTLRHLLPNLTGRRCLADDILMYYWLRQMSHLIVGVGVKSNAIDPLNAVPSIHCSGERCLIGESEAGSPLMWRCLTMGNRYDND